jgi:tRNA A-37 threonylcarbamoyl transferase component Bud32
MAAPAEENKALESEIFKSKYRRIKTVGKGSFGEAVLVRSRADNKRYIAKTIETASMNPKEKRDLQGEIRILAAVNHPNIIRYHEHFEDGTIMFIVMEYADGGDLNQRIKDRKKKEPIEPFDPKLCMFWFLQIAMALKFLHDKRILHRDLKTANVFLTSKNVVKLGDFGISTVLQNTMACAKTVCGTPYYFSPEICQSKPYNNKSDVWALGVCFYEMLTLNRPFNARSLKELLKKILVGQYEPIPQSVPGELRALCQSLLQISPSQRPSINRLLEQPFVQTSLRNFSEELEAQTAKERAEYEERKRQAKTAPATDAPPAAEPAAEAAAAPPSAQAQREAMAAMRNMGRGQLQAMMKQPNAEVEAEIEAQKAQPGSAGSKPAGGAGGASADDASPDVEEDHDNVKQKQAMQSAAAAMVGKSVGVDEEFGDDANAIPDAKSELIPLANGATVPASDVRKYLEGEIGAANLAKVMEYVNDLLSSPSAPSNASIQRELNAMLGPQHAVHSNAITRLAVWEGKMNA